ncbi:hypothetical protein OK074_5050 [Actinobacteria bacterium OK074]|nr:hypothetical protein OK074_5050 [Actinobacteria bacterium OK074]
MSAAPARPIQTVHDFIVLLGKCDPKAELRLAVCPAFPFSHFVGDIAVGTDEDGFTTVFLGEAGQQGYLPPGIAAALGWAPPTDRPIRNRRAVRDAE